ncbi:MULTISPECIES: FeoA family protein [Weeksella]|uniref:FeoA family protein n=1 Tax=Weeksella virosa (strain ATCC 43766 / DSM 16922 / JCM 21250 / CCUG 30538 / CDC 9751 / IAM 14551 / NBRC 16016 / NCTC 11634 / CL345/78) TaxID=865938 RepID=F0P2F0_WEEVC|nr:MULTISPECIES: FeoA family protein [Weeksella]ADX66762.1 FeoA family protein [Weeksella virosa DSM 16922]MDK7374763.1 FeoA family protein [Weeksella virosa]MDK7675147.1 FeoA family protein [Weeksella virosa]OFM85442.1 iron transporter FeoA [Weeksella sp. HMSC059D05]SUP53034.1 ferrous iron transport protein A [Weeksella virosa]
MHLGLLEKGQVGIIQNLSTECRQEVRQRLLDLGFVRGAEISIRYISPLGDPIAYSIHDTLISLRKEDAVKVLIDLKK